MKVCQRCGAEIDTKDGENLCQDCERRRISRKKAAQRRREIDDVMDSLGLVKVRGAMGGTYYE
jgi:DNA-directed RNA polymerase subunit RPC12/RpoP